MINTEVNSNVLGNSGSVMPPVHKHSPLAKKTALRDVQNENRSFIGNHLETSPILEGRPISDAIKVSGTKRLTPECPTSPPLYPSLSKNGGSEHLVHARRKFESDPGKDRMHDNMDKSADCLQLSSNQSYRKQQELLRQSQMRESNLNCAPVVRPNHMASPMTLRNGGPSVPTFLGKHGNGLPAAESNCLKVNSAISHQIDSKATGDEQREERLLHLQKFLKQCDDSNNRDYIKMLVNFAPAELSRHAVELEKRAIQLTFEEGEQMKRMKDLNILGKPGPTTNPSLTTQHTQSRK